MKLVIGLGNPGEKFENNRHNAGVIFIDRYPDLQISRLPDDIKMFKTDCFMNDSGRFVAEKVKFYKIEAKDLVIVHDDLDIPLGKFKIDFGVGPKVHNGISSIEEALGSKEFWRIRIGTDNRQWIKDKGVEDGNKKLGDTGHDYVLEDFSDEEMKVLEEVFPKIWEQLKSKF